MSIKFFGQFLLERNVITPQQLLEAVEFQETKNLKFGAYAVLKGYLTNDEVKRVLDEQKRIDMPFGELAVKLKLLTASQVEELLTLQKNDHILLGEALLQKGFLTNDSLQREIELFLVDQRQYIPGEVMFPKEVKNPLLIRDFVDLTQKMLMRIAHIKVKADVGTLGYRVPKQADVIVFTRLSGSYTYDYTIATSYPVAGKITSGMLGQNAFGEPREVILDGVKEFCNIVCGNLMAKMGMRGKNLSLGAPQEVSSSHGIPQNRKAITFSLRSTEGDINLILVEG